MPDTPLDLFAQGRLAEAVRLQRDIVSTKPDDAHLMLFAELLLFDGQFAEARQQIDLFPIVREGMKTYVQEYRLLLDAEMQRQRLSIDRNPSFLCPPAKHVDLRLAALEAMRKGHQEAAQDLLDEAEEAFPPITGHVDGREFELLRDTDELLGPVFECLSQGDYLWVPADQVRTLRLHPRRCPRDLYFAPARLITRDGEELQVYIPGLYAGTHLSDDGDLRTGQATDWRSEADGPVRGVGLRILAVGEEELSLQEFTQLELR